MRRERNRRYRLKHKPKPLSEEQRLAKNKRNREYAQRKSQSTEWMERRRAQNRTNGMNSHWRKQPDCKRPAVKNYVLQVGDVHKKYIPVGMHSPYIGAFKDALDDLRTRHIDEWHAAREKKNLPTKDFPYDRSEQMRIANGKSTPVPTSQVYQSLGSMS